MSETARTSENVEFNSCGRKEEFPQLKEDLLAKNQKPLQSLNRASHKVKSHFYCGGTHKDQITFVKSSAQCVLQRINVR